MLRLTGLWLATAAVALAGCAHPIGIAPNVGVPPQSASGPASKANVGYFISNDERAKSVVTPGGGGDKVTYTPYKDLEPSIYSLLNSLFANVSPVPSVTDRAFLAAKGITIVLRPTISTNSASSNLLVWPPTQFWVTIDVKASDPEGKLLWEGVAQGKGEASFSEMSTDFSLAAKRASALAIAELREKLLASPLMR